MSKDIHKWTTGRYTLMFDEHTFFVFDNEKEKRMTALKVTKKLNEQQATIQSLKEENEQLRQQLQEYKENWDDMVELATKTSLRNVELDEQIGQLRKELGDCEKFRYAVFKRLNDEYIKERSL